MNIKKTGLLLTLVVALGTSGFAFASNDSTTTTSKATATATAKVNINSADAQIISGKVKGIGLKRAEAIVAYRNEHGPFKSFEDLAQVKGIGQVFIQKHSDELNQAFTLS